MDVHGVKRDTLCVVMPVCNEQDAVCGVLEKWDATLRGLGCDYVIRPYNDGSKDSSLDVMRDTAKRLGSQIDVRDKPNGGHGNTVLVGYRDAAADGFDWVFQVDSDDEMGPEKFSDLWKHRIMPLLPETGYVLFYTEEDRLRLLPMFERKDKRLERLDACRGYSLWRMSVANVNKN